MHIGDTYEYKNVVTKEITAGALGSGGLDIFATPFLICWMEAAAYYYMKEQLPEGKSSVGTMVNVRHVSPHPHRRGDHRQGRADRHFRERQDVYLQGRGIR